MRKRPQDDADRLTRQREYQRAYRARKRAAAEEAVKAAQAAVAASPGVMSQAVETSLRAMRWIADSDAASVAQVRSIARMLDELEAAGTVEARRQSIRVHALLSRVLNDLAATPTRRMSYELRSRRAEEAAAVASAPNVSRFERPPKRRPK